MTSENGQHSAEMGGNSPWTRPSAPKCGDTLEASIKGGDQGNLAPGSLSPGSPAGRPLLLKRKGGSMCRQAHERAR